MAHVLGLCHKLAVFHTSRLLTDHTWCARYAAAARHCATCGVASGIAGATAGLPASRVCVIGMGSGVPALAAARAGARVLWIERVERLAACASRLARANNLAHAITVVRCRDWSELGEVACLHPVSEGSGGLSSAALSSSTTVKLTATDKPAVRELEPALAQMLADKFDAVITEEVHPCGPFILDSILPRTSRHLVLSPVSLPLTSHYQPCLRPRAARLPMPTM